MDAIATLRYVAAKLDNLRFAGVDQNPGGIRDLLSSAVASVERDRKALADLLSGVTRYDERPDSEVARAALDEAKARAEKILSTERT